MAKFSSKSNSTDNNSSANSAELPIYSLNKDSDSKISIPDPASDLQKTLVDIAKKLNADTATPLSKVKNIKEDKLDKELVATNKKLDSLTKLLTKIEKSMDKSNNYKKITSNIPATIGATLNPYAALNPLNIRNQNRTGSFLTSFASNMMMRQGMNPYQFMGNQYHQQQNNPFPDHNNDNIQNSGMPHTGVDDPKKPDSTGSSSWLDTILEGYGIKKALGYVGGIASKAAPWGIGMGAAAGIGAYKAGGITPYLSGEATKNTYFGNKDNLKPGEQVGTLEEQMKQMPDPFTSAYQYLFGKKEESKTEVSAPTINRDNKSDKILKDFKKENDKNKEKVIIGETDNEHKLRAALGGGGIISPPLPSSQSLQQSNLTPSGQTLPPGSAATPNGYVFNNVPQANPNPRPENNTGVPNTPRNNTTSQSVSPQITSEPGPTIGGTSTGTGGLPTKDQINQFQSPDNKNEITPNVSTKLDIDNKSHINPENLYSNLVDKFSKSNLNGYVPPDGEKFGIKTGSPQEWARFGVAVARQESGFNTKSTNLSDPGGSFGIYQFNQHQEGLHGNAYDPEASAKSFVDYTSRVVPKGGIAEMGNTSRGHQGLFGSIKRPNETIQNLNFANKIGDKVDAKGYTSTQMKSTDIKVTSDKDKQLNSSVLDNNALESKKTSDKVNEIKTSIKNDKLSSNLLDPNTTLTTKFTQNSGINPTVTPLTPVGTSLGTPVLPETFNNPDPRGINGFTGDANKPYDKPWTKVEPESPNSRLDDAFSQFDVVDNVKTPAAPLDNPDPRGQNGYTGSANPSPTINNTTVNHTKEDSTGHIVDSIKPKAAGAPADLSDLFDRHWSSGRSDNGSENFAMPFST